MPLGMAGRPAPGAFCAQAGVLPSGVRGGIPGPPWPTGTGIPMPWGRPKAGPGWGARWLGKLPLAGWDPPGTRGEAGRAGACEKAEPPVDAHVGLGPTGIEGRDGAEGIGMPPPARPGAEGPAGGTTPSPRIGVGNAGAVGVRGTGAGCGALTG